MPPYQYVQGSTNTVLDTDSLAWVPISEPSVQAAILADAVLPADVPEPIPTAAEQLDALVAEGKAALAAATTLAEVKGVFSATLDGMKTIYGTPS